MSATIVIVDDEIENLIFLQRVLKSYNLETFANPIKAYEYIRKNRSIEMLITDQKMPEISGIELVKRINIESKGILSIVISAYTDPEDLINAVNSQLIYKYVVKPFKPEYLRNLVEKALETHSLKRAMALRDSIEIKEKDPLGSFLTITEIGENLKKRAKFFAQSDSPLFIHGETGTGKEVLAMAIHSCSSRKEGPFIAVNCAALSKELFLSELFGYIKGAFSGAGTDKKGFVNRAEGGTLFLDEVSEIALEHQASLLRFIQYSTFYPVGSSEEQTADVRIISASHIHLKDLKDNREFREDLYYRLSPFDLYIPPLRERKDDIALMFLYYFEKFSIDINSIESAVWKILINYKWKGNVRQLIHACEKASIILKMNDSRKLTKEMLKDIINEDILHSKPTRLIDYNVSLHIDEKFPEPIDLTEHLMLIEKEYIEKYMAAFNNNISRTAEALGLSRQGLKNKLRRYFVGSISE